VRVATGTVGYKHREADLAAVKASLQAPNFRERHGGTTYYFCG
jgi:acetoacetate decarboxylase